MKYQLAAELTVEAKDEEEAIQKICEILLAESVIEDSLTIVGTKHEYEGRLYFEEVDVEDDGE